MQTTQRHSAANALDAKKVKDHAHTIAVLMDDRPGFEPSCAREMIDHLRGHGYAVHEVTAEEFSEKDLAQLGFLLLVPHAQSVPIELVASLERYWKHGGNVLLLGGPLFGHLIRREDGVYRKAPLQKGTLDALHFADSSFVMEGVAPTHKVFIEQSVSEFFTEPYQSISQATIGPADAQTIVCPVARPHGLGYRMEHRNRMIPLVSAMGRGGRAGGRRGAAAFIMLSSTRGHLRRTNGSRPGSVSATTPGSCVGMIGLTQQKLMRIPGVPALLLDMVDAMCRGIYLYEAGSERLVCRPGEQISVGAKILSLSQDFQTVAVEMRIRHDGAEVARFRQELLANARAYTEMALPYTFAAEGDYEIVTELFHGDLRIDQIAQEARVLNARVGAPEEFVRAEGGEFACQGKHWYAYGMNYWPLYYPSFEREDYWMGWLDKSNYDPLEVERDLAQMENMHINLVCTRMDGDVFGRSMDALKDFVERCRRHGMKLMLSYANATNPLYYQPLATEKLILESGLKDDPILFCHDISWETGSQAEAYIDYWDDGWRAWIDERYGNLENAENDWGMPVDLDEAGRPVHPPRAQLADDGPWRVKVSAYRRYLDDMVSRRWNDAVRHIRSLDPNHLITFRGGSVHKSPGFYLTGTVKHVDFMALEGYSCEQSEDGLGGMISVSLLAKLLSGGKPVTWVEYGLSLIGTSGNSPWEALKWDGENLAPLPEMLEEQRAYNALFYAAFREAGIVGTAPWWYPGGFRRVECSDCGHVSPNGVPRPVWTEYLNQTDWFFAPREPRVPDEILMLDPDATSQGWGRYCQGSGMVDRQDRDMARVWGRPVDEHPGWGEALVACREAWRLGRHVDFRTSGTGTTSAEMPMLAVGNIPMNGTNPPKYLDAEFNEVTLIFDGGRVRVRGGDEILLPAGSAVLLEASAGNLREAKWLKLDAGIRGGVWLKSSMQGVTRRLGLNGDVPYLSDAYVCGVLTESVEGVADVVLRMEALGISDFGEALHFRLVAEGRG